MMQRNVMGCKEAFYREARKYFDFKGEPTVDQNLIASLDNAPTYRRAYFESSEVQEFVHAKRRFPYKPCAHWIWADACEACKPVNKDAYQGNDRGFSRKGQRKMFDRRNPKTSQQENMSGEGDEREMDSGEDNPQLQQMIQKMVQKALAKEMGQTTPPPPQRTRGRNFVKNGAQRREKSRGRARGRSLARKVRFQHNFDKTTMDMIGINQRVDYHSGGNFPRYKVVAAAQAEADAYLQMIEILVTQLQVASPNDHAIGLCREISEALSEQRADAPVKALAHKKSPAKKHETVGNFARNMTKVANTKNWCDI